MIDLYREIVRRRAQGQKMALATVIDTRGSTPRELGAKMVVAEDRSIVGTIGGGYAEHQIWKIAPDVITTGRARAVRVELTADIASNEGAICGGVMDIFVEPIG